VFDVEFIEDTGHFRLPLFRLGQPSFGSMHD